MFEGPRGVAPDACGRGGRAGDAWPGDDGGDRGEAAADWEEAVRWKSDTGVARVNLGRVRAQTEDVEKAIRGSRIAFELDRNLWWSHLSLRRAVPDLEKSGGMVLPVNRRVP